MIIGGKETPGGLTEPSLGESEASLAGVRSPPLRGEVKRNVGGLAGKAPK